MTITAYRAQSEADAKAVETLWIEAAAWLRQRGSDQWQYPVRTHLIREKISQGVCWLFLDEQKASVATITLDEDADPALWCPDDEPASALYVHRLVTRRTPPIPDAGSAILDWAARRASNQNKQWLRLDAWTTNTGLHGYYLSHGFTHVRTINDSPSGALFQRRASQQTGLGPHVAELTSK
jgi:hypothetical protein